MVGRLCPTFVHDGAMTASAGPTVAGPATLVPYRVRASWSGELLAESDRAVRIDDPVHGPSVWFPWDDVVSAGRTPSGVEAWRGGEVERFDLDGPVPRHGGPVTWDHPGEGAADGVGVLRRWVRPPASFEALQGHATVDHERALVEVVDGVAGNERRDVTIKRFPTWGDAADLIDILDRGVVVHDAGRPVVEGSQILGQAIVAALRRYPGRRVVSGHLVFLKVAGTL